MHQTIKKIPASSLWMYVVVFAVWLLFSVLVTAFAVSSSLHAAQDRSTQFSRSLYADLFDTMQANEAALEGFAALFGAIGKTDEDTARRYAAQVMQRYPYIFMMEIVEPVRREDLASFTSRQRKRYPGFEVRTFSYQSDRQWQPLPDKPVYYPIVFMEPMRPGSEKVLGLDVGSVDFLRVAMQQSLRDGATSSARPFRLVEGNLAYVAFRPIAADNKHALGGQTVELVVDAEQLVNFADGGQAGGFDVRIYHADFPEADPQGQLAAHPAPAPGAFAAWLLPKYQEVRPIGVPGQPFVLAVRKQVDWADLNRPLLAAIFSASAVCLLILSVLVRLHYVSGQKYMEAERQLRHLATYDSLTGLPNRNLLMDRLRQGIARAQRQNSTLAPLLLDLNGFKAVNDSLGHDAGDQLLRVVADRINLCVRADDTVARWSGDEFVIVIETVDMADDVRHVVRKIQDTIAHPVHLGQAPIGISASIGVARFPLDTQQADELIRIADQRMYVEKRAAAPATPAAGEDAGP